MKMSKNIEIISMGRIHPHPEGMGFSAPTEINIISDSYDRSNQDQTY